MKADKVIVGELVLAADDGPCAVENYANQQKEQSSKLFSSQSQ
jgi:hypothetical protein